MIYAQKLQKNDLVGVCAPAGPIHRETLLRGIQFLKDLGLQVIVGKNIYQKNHYLSGTDNQRLEDFYTLLKDDNVKAIFFARGGYGTARIAPMIDFDLIKKHPKIIWGFSDITYLLIAIFQKSKLITFHGPLVSTVGDKQLDEITASEFQQLFSPSIRIYDETISDLHVIVEGEGAGRIVGGNLSLIVSTIGTPYEIDLQNKILFIEDTGEKLYKIDSYINQLKQSNKLNELKGIVIGDFKDVFSGEGEILSVIGEVETSFNNNEKLLGNDKINGVRNSIEGVYEITERPTSENVKRNENDKQKIPRNVTDINDRANHKMPNFSNTNTTPVQKEQIGQQLFNQLFYHYFEDLHIPVMSGFKIGHCFPNFVIPYGAHAKLYTKNKQLIIEPGVK